AAIARPTERRVTDVCLSRRRAARCGTSSSTGASSCRRWRRMRRVSFDSELRLRTCRNQHYDPELSDEPADRFEKGKGSHLCRTTEVADPLGWKRPLAIRQAPCCSVSPWGGLHSCHAVANSSKRVQPLSSVVQFRCRLCPLHRVMSFPSRFTA